MPAKTPPDREQDASPEPGPGPDATAAKPARHRARRAAKPKPEIGYRIALGVIALLAAVVIVSLPFAFSSMAGTLLSQQRNPFFDVFTLQQVASTVGEDTTNRSYFNLGVTGIDPNTGLATLALSGNRSCTTDCPKVVLTFLALDDNASERRGLPPFATLTLAADERVFSESLQLPVRGQPSLYPFDTYDLWLGLRMEVTGADGKTVEATRDQLQARSVVTLQNQTSQFTMANPTAVDPARVAAASDPSQLPLVVALEFTRPEYLKVLAVLLVLLISASGVIALLTRDINDLLLGIGGLILGVWGIRSVLVNQPLPGISAVDLALSYVILFLLLGLILRLAGYFHRRSHIPWPWVRRE